MYLFRPYDEALPEYIVGCARRDTSQDQIAVVEVPATPAPVGTKPRGNLQQLLGPVGDPEAERTGLLAYYCPTRHKRDAEIPAPDTSLDYRRIRLSAETGWLTFHIDPAGCRDIDDALAYKPSTDEWVITIADAAAAVPAGSPVDQIAAAIGATFYGTGGNVVRPMLPPAISDDTASLLPGQWRRGISWFVKEQRWVATWINVQHSFTYDSFPTSEIARICGAAEEDPHDFVERMMIAYNHAAARTLAIGAPTTGILRAQSPPDAAAVAHWAAIDPVLGFMAHEAATYCSAATPDNGHAGLGLDVYCHASSPLRRYVDLVNQRALKALIQGSTPPATSAETIAHANARTKANRRWTRDLTFLENVQPGRVSTIDVVWVDAERVWVPVWRRLLRLRHEAAPRDPGTRDRIAIFCDPTKRNWQRRILTASYDSQLGRLPPSPASSSPADAPAPPVPTPTSPPQGAVL